MRILETLLRVSVYAAALFAAVALLRFVLGKRLSPALRLGMWLLVILRLMVPFTLESPLHLFPGARSASPVSALADAAYEAPLLQFRSAQTTSVDGTGAAEQSGLASDVQARTQGAARELRWADALLGLWVLGMLVRGGLLLRAEMRMRRILREEGQRPGERAARIYEACRYALSVRRNLPLLTIDHLSTPALTVSFAPKLLLPRDLADTLTDRQLALSLTHELTHFRRGDHLLCMALRLLETVYWFHPVVWWMGRLAESDMEAACDSRVVRNMGRGEKKEYALTLITMFSRQSRPQFVLGMARDETRRAAERRVRGVFGRTRSTRCAMAVSSRFRRS